MSITKETLRKLNHQIDCECGCATEAYSTLTAISIETLPHWMQMKVQYMKGKYLFEQWKDKHNISLLEKAHTLFDQIFIIARSQRLEVRDPRHWFKRIFTKHTLSLHLDGEDQEQLYQRCKGLILQAQNKFPDNSSFLWLATELGV